MSPSTRELALNKLLAFTPPQKGRNAQADQALGELVRRAAAVAEALTATGGGDELRRRAAEFDSLTAAGSSFDAAREEVCSHLSQEGANLPLPEYSARAVGSGRKYPDLNADGSWAGTFSGRVSYPDRLPEVSERWADRERTRWDLGAALEDAKAVLALQLSPTQEALFSGWRDQVWGVLLRADQGHYLGSFLLVECQKAVDPATARPDDYDALLGRLAVDPVRFAGAIKAAAEHLFHSCDPAPQPPPPGPAPAAAGCHPVTEPIPADFKLGPITGTLKWLAELLCPSYEYESDPRALKRLGEAGAVWVQRVKGKSYKVYFKEDDRVIYARANLRDMERKKQKQEANAQEATK
jgi:hypothetical protein